MCEYTWCPIQVFFFVCTAEKGFFKRWQRGDSLILLPGEKKSFLMSPYGEGGREKGGGDFNLGVRRNSPFPRKMAPINSGVGTPPPKALKIKERVWSVSGIVFCGEKDFLPGPIWTFLETREEFYWVFLSEMQQTANIRFPFNPFPSREMVLVQFKRPRLLFFLWPPGSKMPWQNRGSVCQVDIVTGLPTLHNALHSIQEGKH